MHYPIINENRETTACSTWMLFNLARNAVYRLRELELAQYGLTVEQSTVLYHLINNGGASTARTIEYITLRQHHSISTLINRMIGMQLVARKKSPDNKRFKILITAEGEELYQKIPVRSVESVFEPLQEKEREQLSSSLKTLLKKARDLLGLSFVPPFLQPVDRENRNMAYTGAAKSPDYELWMIFNRARNSVYRLRELELAQYGLTVEQCAVLQLIISRGGVSTARTIEYLTLRQHHSISTLITRMAGMNLVDRKKGPDNKKYEISITREGEELYKKVPVQSLEMVFSPLKEKDRERMRADLRTILEKARELLGLTPC